MGTSTQSHDGVHFKIYPHFWRCFSGNFPIAFRKAFFEGYDKSMNSQIFNAILSLDLSAAELGSKDTFGGLFLELPSKL